MEYYLRVEADFINLLTDSNGLVNQVQLYLKKILTIFFKQKPLKQASNFAISDTASRLFACAASCWSNV